MNLVFKGKLGNPIINKTWFSGEPRNHSSF